MGLGRINSYQSSILGFSSNSLHITCSKSQEIGRHTWSRFKLPNASRFAVFNINFWHIRQSQLTLCLVKFQSQIKSCLSLWLIHTRKGFAGKMALKLRRNNLFFHTIYRVVRWVNPRHIVRNLTSISYCHHYRTGRFQLDIKSFIVLIKSESTSLASHLYSFNCQIFLM